MEGQKHLLVENEYNDLIARLERANDSLVYYKNTKEICLRDLQKLELENSALAEENNYLKKRIKNVERNMSVLHDRTSDPDHSPDMHESLSSASKGSKIHTRYSSVRQTLPPLHASKNFDNVTTTSATYRPPSNIKRTESLSRTCKRDLDVYEKGFLCSVLLYRV